MIKVEIIHPDDGKEKLEEIYRFRYKSYIEELNYLRSQDNMTAFECYKLEYDSYDDSSRHIVLRDQYGIVAYARIILDQGAGLLVLNKIGYRDFLKGKNKVEISRMIIKASRRCSKLIVLLLNELYRNLRELDCDYIVADTFDSSNSYWMLKKMGFQELGVRYTDEDYRLRTDSVVLYCELGQIKMDDHFGLFGIREESLIG